VAFPEALVGRAEAGLETAAEEEGAPAPAAETDGGDEDDWLQAAKRYAKTHGHATKWTFKAIATIPFRTGRIPSGARR